MIDVEPRKAAPQALLIALGVSLGVCTWMLWMAGPVDESAFVPYALTTTAIALTLGAVLNGIGTWHMGFALVLGPILLAPFTASRGDGDGLWVFQFAYLILLGIVCVAAIWIGVRVSLPEAIGLMGRSRPALWFLAGAATLLAAVLITVRWPNPWSSMEEAMASFRLPGFEVARSVRTGNALCYQACGPTLTHIFTTDAPESLACDQLERAVRERDVRIETSLPCYARGELMGGPLDRLIVTAAKAETAVASRPGPQFQITLEATR